MSKIEIFEEHHARYDAWFDEHSAAYVSELLALRPFVPLEGHGLEVGVGSGRFAAPLGVAVGVDLSQAMLALAATRGVQTVNGNAEDLPFADATFDYALSVTTLCFVDSPLQMFSEIHRVLKPHSPLTLGFIDSASDVGRLYLALREESIFYRAASFYSFADVRQLLTQAGFTVEASAQTLSHPLSEMREIEPVHPGHGHGAFVVIAART